MKLQNMILLAILAVVFVAFWSFQVDAYNLVSAAGDPGAGNCNQCHTFPGANHELHTGAMACAVCHGDFGAQVLASSCTACHPVEGYPAEGLFASHGPLEAPNGDYCGYCHAGVGAVQHSWSELKHLFE